MVGLSVCNRCDNKCSEEYNQYVMKPIVSIAMMHVDILTMVSVDKSPAEKTWLMTIKNRRWFKVLLYSQLA